MPDWTQAMSAAGSGVVLELEVVPNAPASKFPSGYDPWRNKIQARVQAPPLQGRANEELCRLVGRFFGVPPTSVEVVSGSQGRQKRVTVRGIDPGTARQKLGAALDGS